MNLSRAALGALAAVMAVTGCTVPREALAEEAVEELTADLSSGSFDSGVIVDPTDAEIWHAYALGPLIDTWRTVEAGNVVVDGDTAEVDLTWTFHLDGGQVSVPAHATLTRDGGGWHLAWVPTVLHDAATEESEYVISGGTLTLLDESADGTGRPGGLPISASGD